VTLRLENIEVMVARRRLLAGVSLEARRGELLMIIGPNGAGKTTLLKAIAGLVPCDGEMTWDEAPMKALSARQRAAVLSYLPQGHVAHWPLIARDIVAIGRAPRRGSLDALSTSDVQAINEALEAVSATALAERTVTELSGGERARIMLARALAARAPLMLADEPVASLDAAHQLSIMNILSGLAKAGHLILAVVHDMVLAARFADRLIVLKDGRLVADGRPCDILSPGLLKDVFNVEAMPFVSGDVTLHIPWKTLPGSG
jgi:iron complex transport system ATP-binding protein